jgi:hypothetical protein
VKAAQKLVGAPTIRGGSARAGGGGGGRLRRQISPQLAENHKNGMEIRRFHALFALKIAKKTVFRSKVLNKVYSKDVF